MKRLFLILLFIPNLSFGWGAEGHRIIGAITEMYLDDVTRSKLNKIMGKESMEDISNWLDWRRDDWNGAQPFHYISMPVDALEYKAEHCENDEVCAVSMIYKYKDRLLDKHESPESKAEAIKVIVHLFEDLHMPLHTGGQEGDYGGNKVKIDYFGKKTNLHKLFDFEVIERSGKSEEQWVVELTQDLSQEKIDEIQSGGLFEWINDSHTDVNPIYENLKDKEDGIYVIDKEYEEFADKIIRQQMLEAGLRLAKYLNETMAKVVIN